MSENHRHLSAMRAPARHSPLEHLNDILRYYAEGCRVDVVVHGVDPDEYADLDAPETGPAGHDVAYKRLTVSNSPAVVICLFPRRP